MEQYDFVAIGDTVVDAFIRIKDAAVHCTLDNENCELCFRFGDKVPYKSLDVLYAVGNSPNASVSAAKLGLKAALISTVGNDENGSYCLGSLKSNGVDCRYISRNRDFPTNYHFVLWYDVERTILVKHAPFPYALPKNFSAPKWIYLSSMGEHSLAYHHEIAKFLELHPETKLAFQPGTFQMKFGVDALRDIYQKTDILFLNVQEAERILKTSEHDKVKLMIALHALGPKIIVMTDGYEGAYLFDGANAYFMPIYPHTPIERTGAGDAFASTFTAALALGKTPLEAITWAPINAMSVTQQVGAQRGLLTQEHIMEYLSKAPADYKIKKIN